MAFRRLDIPLNPQAPSEGLMKLGMQSPFEGLLKQVEQFSEKGAATLGAQYATADVMAGKNPSPSLGLTTMGQAYNEAAQKAYVAKTTNDLRAKSVEVMGQYSGMKLGDAAAADNLMKAHIEALSSQVPEQFRAQVLGEAEARRADVFSRVRAAEQDNQFKLNVQTIQDGIKGDAAEAQMRARDGAPMEIVAKIDARAKSRIADLVNMGVYTQDMANTAMKEYTDMTHAESVIGNAIRSGNIMGTVEAVQSGQGQFSETPLKIRDYIVRELSQEVSRRDALARKQQTEDDKTVKNIIESLNKGQGLNSVESTIKDRVLAGQIPVTTETLKDLSIAESVSRGMSQLMSVGPDDAAKMFQGVLAAVPQDQIGRDIQDRLKKSFFEHVSKVRGDDGLAYVESIGGLATIAGNPVLDTSSLDSFVASFAQRKNAIDTARHQYKTDFPYFTKQDAESVGTMFGGLTTDQKVAFFGQMKQLIGDDAKYRQAIDMIWKDKTTAFAKAGDVAATNPQMAREIIYGQAMIDTKQVSLENGKIESVPVVASTALALRGSDPEQKTFASYRAAASALYASRYPGLVGSAFDPEKFGLCMEEIAGKTAGIGFNGDLQLLPPGWSKNEFDDRWSSVSDEEILNMGGTKEIAYMLRTRNMGMGTSAYTQEATQKLLDRGYYPYAYSPETIKQMTGLDVPSASVLSRNTLAFHRISDGKYVVYDGMAPVKDAQGNSFILDTSMIARKPSPIGERAAAVADVLGQFAYEAVMPGTFLRLGELVNGR